MKNVHLVTGGNSGIGLECAKLFKEGVVLLSGIDEKQLLEASKSLEKSGIDVAHKIADVTDKDDLEELFEYASSLGKLRSVVHAAGVSGSVGDAMVTLKIDLLGTYYVIEESFKHAKEGTAVILIASMMGHMVSPNEEEEKALRNPDDSELLKSLSDSLKGDADEAYNYAKHGVQLLTKANATRFGQKGARIVSVSPGIIMTEMAKKASEEHPEQMKYMESITPIKRNGRPEDVSELVIFLASDKASFITGTDILIDGGLTLNLQKQEQIK